MSKYEPLWKYIKNSNSNIIKLTFLQINNILNFNLDHSFLKYKKEIENYGYKIEKISLKNQFIIFSKI